ncbi:MAG: type II toxin-antitoxin system prevent-host-death family antitoxin [Clostridiaceae bacterium]
MIKIRPISDLRNKFTEIEKEVSKGEPVFLTKNGYGSMVVMSLKKYSELTDGIEEKLDEADRVAEESDIRYSSDEVFGGIREALNGAKVL